MMSTYLNGKKAAEQQRRADRVHDLDAHTISELKNSVESAKHLQEESTLRSEAKLSALSAEMLALQSALEKAGLQKEADNLRSELASTRKALSPPKAILVASLAEIGGPEDLTRKELTVTVPADRVVKFTLLVSNTSEVQARNGTIGVRLCQQCSYAPQPVGFSRPPGADDTDRQRAFLQLPATEAFSTIIAIRLPLSTTAGFSIGILARCENCQAEPFQTLRFNIR